MRALFIILLFASQTCFGQSSANCGTWRDSVTMSDWEFVDTPLNAPDVVEPYEWIESEWVNQNELHVMDAINCPCGCPETQLYLQYRIDNHTGIRQLRYKQIDWVYIPSQYEIAERRFNYR